jgi:hypothetical protein
VVTGLMDKINNWLVLRIKNWPVNMAWSVATVVWQVIIKVWLE